MRRACLRAVGWVLGVLTYLLARTVRREVQHDPRPALRARGVPYVYALLHAHQIAAVLAADDPGVAAMVSRSADGDLLVPALRLRQMAAVRGSTRSAARDKGGRRALAELAATVRGGRPALLAVDGPRGPRSQVRRGIVALARQTGAAILPLVVLPSRRTVLRRTWDRMQLPWPGCRIRMIFAPPIRVAAGAAGAAGAAHDGAAGPAAGGAAAVDACVAQAVARALAALEAAHDPVEAGGGAGADAPARARAAAAPPRP